MPDLTVKQKEFCRLMAEGKCKNQSDAYRKAFKSKMKSTSLKVEASRLMAKSNIALTIKELSQPVDLRVRKTREDVLDKYQAGGWFDTRKMFDLHGNPIDIPNLSDDEAMMLEGFEIVEEFSGKGADRVPVGYTRKFKLGDRHKYLTSYAKMMGFISDDPLPIDSSLKSLTVVFVNSQGKPVDVNFNPHTRQISRVDAEETPRHKPGVTFVGHRP